MNDHNYGITSAELKQFVERAEQLALEKREVADQEKELFAEMKGRGFDVKIVKAIMKERKRNPDDIAEEEAIKEMYRAALSDF
jgi:uncharacterized protein (UPF0335 family)